jgi:phosphatidylinositol glycan class B
MSYKLGLSPVQDLPIEFRERMRPWLFPGILYGMTQGLVALGIKSPFTWTFFYRLFSAFIGWISTASLILCCPQWFENQKSRRWAILAMTFLWYLPALHARTSSENLSGSIFVIALSLIVWTLPRLNAGISFGIGLLFGLAFEFRYQVAVMILGAILWLWIIARVSIRRLIPMGLGLAFVIAFGFLIDRWGYGEWSVAPWNYIRYNLIDNHVSDADTSPFWDYFRRAFTESWPFIGFLTLVSFPIAWIRNPKHILTWGMFPLFLIHEIIGHKELRFLFPMFHAGGVLILMSIDGLSWNWLKTRWVTVPVKILIGLNLLGLVALTIMPAWTPIRFYEKLYSFRPTPEFAVYYKDSSLFSLGGTVMNFYRPKDTPFIHVNDYSEFANSLKNPPQTRWFFSARNHLPPDAGELSSRCQIEFSTLPTWIYQLNIKNLMQNVTNWTLFRCTGK